MSDPVDGRTEALYALVASLPRHDHTFARADLPANGLYLFFERGETVEVNGRLFDRIVRVGTHRGDGRLPKRLRQHFGGNRRGSVFRMHLGGAILRRDDPGDPRLAAWVGDRGVRMPETESVVSLTLQEWFSFCCVRVDDPAERLNLERGLIALLALNPLGPLSGAWLGRDAVHPAIRSSGLWNTQHVGAEPFEYAAFNRFQEKAQAHGRGKTTPYAAR
jgi:hypothetical protein